MLASIWTSLRKLALILFCRRPHRRRRPKPDRIDLDAQLTRLAAPWCRTRKKPLWVEQEVIRLRAMGYGLGYARIASAFNRMHAHLGERVSKSTVQRIVNANREAIAALRREHKHAIPKSPRRSAIWAMDLCVVADSTAKQRMILGIVDHGTRACIALSEIHHRTTAALLRELYARFRKFGFPKCIRVDNDAANKSKLMRSILWMLGVRLQTTDPGCPWQNGRIERFFGTFKSAIKKIAVAPGDLTDRLTQFRAFYNFAREHQNLKGRTPAEAWTGARKAVGDGVFIEAWSGQLVGWYFPKHE